MDNMLNCKCMSLFYNKAQNFRKKWQEQSSTCTYISYEFDLCSYNVNELNVEKMPLINIRKPRDEF